MDIQGHNFHLRPAPPSSEEVAEVIGPWMNFAIDAFGADRCMFEVRSRLALVPVLDRVRS